jgi:hypothetical protein
MSDLSTLLVATAVLNAVARHTADYLNVESAVTYRQSKGTTVSFKRQQICWSVLLSDLDEASLYLRPRP